MNFREMKVKFHTETLPSQAMVNIIIGIADRTASEFKPHYEVFEVPVEDLMRYYVENKELRAVEKIKRDLYLDGKACSVVDMWDQTLHPAGFDLHFENYWRESHERYKANLF